MVIAMAVGTMIIDRNYTELQQSVLLRFDQCMYLLCRCDAREDNFYVFLMTHNYPNLCNEPKHRLMIYQ